jgi:hypothetical protein
MASMSMARRAELKALSESEAERAMVDLQYAAEAGTPMNHSIYLTQAATAHALLAIRAELVLARALGWGPA